MFLIAYVGTAILITLFVMGVAAKLAKEKGKNPVKWAGLSFAALFVLVAWDYYPSRWAHQYYCEKEAGFWVYKTLEQWKAENPGVMETLVANKGALSIRDGDMVNHTDTYSLNQRFNWVVAWHDAISLRLLPIRRIEQIVIDTKTNGVLARYVDFAVGYGNPLVVNLDGLRGLKFWLHSEHCSGGEINDSKLAHFFMAAKNLNEGS